MIKTLGTKPSTNDVIRKINEIIELLVLTIEAQNKTATVVQNHDQELDMITDMLSQDIPTGELDS